MKSTGIVRKIDNLGRIVLPVELRRTLNMSIKDPVEIFTEGNQVILQKYEKTCCICGNTELSESTTLFGKTICSKCAEAIKTDYDWNTKHK